MQQRQIENNNHNIDSSLYNNLSIQGTTVTPQATSPGHLGLEEDATQEDKHTILLMNCESKVSLALKKFLSDDNYEMLNTSDTELTLKTLESINPQLLVLGVEQTNSELLQRIRSFKNNASTAGLHVIIYTAKAVNVDEADALFEAGVIDCISSDMNASKLGLRLKATFLQVNALKSYQKREQSIRERHGMLAHELEHLQQKMATGQREAHAHLELLMHSKEVKGTIVDKINDLKPYLNVHGKAKLKQLTRQIKWELSEEEELTLERKFDESNFLFYEQLSEKSNDLTRYEMRLCAYLRSNNSSADIARITRKTANCINVAFARIRSKLSMKNNNELKSFLRSILSSESSLMMAQ
ncbi:MAG: hypothetical protein RJQ14_12780 [Marinoscillum sp.]